MRIHHLNCGTLQPFARRFVNGDGGFFSTGELVCHCLLIETAQSLVLVDTGFGTLDILDPMTRLGRGFMMLSRPKLDRAECAVHQIEKLGFDREDVGHIILSHMDLDHAGGLSDFPRAAVHVMAKEFEAASDPRRRDHGRYRTQQWAHRPEWIPYETKGDRWMGFDAVRELHGLPPEILLIPLAGHSAGHAGIAISCGDEWLLHAGDAYFHQAAMQTVTKVPIGLRALARIDAVDQKARSDNVRRLRDLSQQKSKLVTVHCAHDAAELHRLVSCGDAQSAQANLIYR